ncbi:MAG: protein kinase [Planctomycetaceae bacterium]|nr:protein kinase [Planctomycetaceae bacterium]
MSSNPRSLRSIFLAALEIDTAEERSKFLHVECGSNNELMATINRLLEAHVQEPQFMSACAADILSIEAPAPFCEDLSEHISNRYHIVELLGVGGMGVVYLATQSAPVQRLVAIKLIRTEQNYQEAISQFERERQMLSLMDHQGIPKILDGGVTRGGRPFYVMELVNGQPITEFCDRLQLTIAERLKILITVLETLQHAHQKGVIHRDLKPGNILVEVRDGNPVVRIIDFGIARIQEGQGSLEDLKNSSSEIAGTLNYMSPEQIEGTATGLDTRSDLYSIGVLLYELLTGFNPFTDCGWKPGNQAARVAKFPRPSSRIGTLDEVHRLAVSKNRKEEPWKFRQKLEGELDCITIMAMETDRSCRYQSPEAFAEDIRRYLANDVVGAYPQTATYRLRKSLIRYRLLLAVLMTVISSLAVAAAVGLWQAAEARSARKTAEVHYKNELSEKARFRELAWKTGIKEAWSNWEQNRYAEVSSILQRLKQNDPESSIFPEWQMLERQLHQSYRQLLKIEKPVHEVRLIPNTNKVVAAGGNGSVYVMDLTTFQVTMTIATGVPSLHAIAVSDDGRLLATGGVTDPLTDRSIPIIFNLETGQRIRDLPGQLTTIESLEFSADARYLACGSRYENVQIIETETGQITELPAALRNSWMCRTPEGHQIFVQHDNEKVCVTEFSAPFSYRTQEISTNSRIISSVWTPLTRQLLAISWDHNFMPVRDVGRNIEIGRLADVSFAECFSLSPDSITLHAGLASGEVACWNVGRFLGSELSAKNNQYLATDAISNEPYYEIDLQHRWSVSSTPITSICCSSNWIMLTTFGGELLALRRPTEEDTDTQSVPKEQSVGTIAEFSGDGSFLVVRQPTGVLQRTELPEISETSTESVGCRTLSSLTFENVYSSEGATVSAVAISPDQHFIGMITQKSELLTSMDHAPAVLSAVRSQKDPVQDDAFKQIEFAPDSRHCAWIDGDIVCVANMKSRGEKPQQFKMPGLANCLAWSPDTRRLIVGGDFEHMEVLDLPEGTQSRNFASGNFVIAAIYSIDGRTVITGDHEGALRFWSHDGQLRHGTRLHKTEIVSLALSHDGRIGASVDRQGGVALWYIESGDEIGMVIPPSMTPGRRFNPAIAFTKNDAAFRLVVEQADSTLCLKTFDLRPVE